MKLLNQSIKYLSISILAIVTVWAVFFYINMLNEIKSSIDEGLENYKRLIIQNAQQDSTILTKKYFDESFFSTQKVDKEQALSMKDQYLDTILQMQDADDKALEPEPVRMLISAFQINGEYYELKVANSMVEEDDLIKELLWDVVWLYIILIAGIVFVNNVALKRLWMPFYDFLDQLKGFRLGNSQKLPNTQTRVKEFTDLETAVNALLKDNINAFEQQKQFIGNASHELQTPLAIATNKLELFLENSDLKNDGAESIAEIYQIIQRLVRLNKSLLLLTKIENNQFLDDGTVSINETVHKNVGDLEEMAAFKNIKITINEAAELSTEMDPSLANVIISNLLRNAIFHNISNGNITIDISARAVRISNTGSPQKLDGNLIFNRFYKPDGNSNGTGLGLAIAKAIADVYSFKISYTFESHLHSFQILFPTT